MNLRRFVSLLVTLLLGATLSASALAVGGHGGGGHGGGGHGGGGHGHHGGGGHGHARHGGVHGFHGGGHFGLGVFIGPSFGWYYPGPSYYYPSPSYYYPSRAGVPSAPPVYIEQEGEGYAAQQAYWYYCTESKTYYPYVTQCAGEWHRVPAQPPPNP